MRLILLFFFLLPSLITAQAQLQKKIDFTVQNLSLEDAIIKLSTDSKTNISFSNRIFPKGKTISLIRENESVKNILKDILKSSNLSYKIVSGQIILYKRYLKAKEAITISGWVEDKETGELLIGANVYDPTNSSGTTTNESGFFTLDIFPGESKIEISYLGYETETRSINSNKDLNLKIKLGSSLILPSVIVEVNDSARLKVSNPEIGLETLDIDKIKLMPSLGGESDLLRTLYQATGVQSGADGVGGLHIRGGNLDQNLILMDGVPIYNAVHALGIFSVFNTDAIRKVNLYKGAFPAKFGGRLSSILDVHTKEGNKYKYSGELGIGLISGKATLEGPIVKEKGSFFFSYRRSFTDLYIPEITEQVKENNGTIGRSNYLFSDLNFKANYTLSKKDRIYFSAYAGKDEFSDFNDIEPFTDSLFIVEDWDFLVGEFDDSDSQDLSWGNNLYSLRWNRIYHDKLFSNTLLYYTRYFFESFEKFESIASYENGTKDLFEQRREFESQVVNYGIKTDFEYLVNNRLSFGFGGAAMQHELGLGSLNAFFVAEQVPIFIDTIGIEDNLELANLEAKEYQLYFEKNYKFNSKLETTIGVHASLWNYEGSNFITYQPRLRLLYQVLPKVTIQASASVMNQYLHLLTNSDVGLPADIWVPSTDKVKPERALQGDVLLSIGTIKDFGIVLGAYFKRMENLIEYLDSDGSLILTASNWEDNVTSGEGTSFGFETSISRQVGNTTGTINYTYSKSDRVFEELNEGEYFPYRYDLTHGINFSLSQKIGKKFNFSLTWQYRSGINLTFPTRKFLVPSPFVGQLPLPLGASRTKNGVRLPSNHKLDIGLNYVISEGKLKQSINLGVYNAYNSPNPLYYKIRRDPDDLNNSQLVQVTLFPIMPSLGYSLKF